MSLRPQVSLLTKFRIEADDVIIIPDATRSPREETRELFSSLVVAREDRNTADKKLSTASSGSEASHSSR